VHIPDTHRGKLAAKSLVCTFLGHTQNCRAYRLVHHPSCRFPESCEVIFDEGGLADLPSFERVVIRSVSAETADAEAGGAKADSSEAANAGTGGTKAADTSVGDAGKAGGASESDKEIEEMLTMSPKLPTPTLASTRPKRTVRVCQSAMVLCQLVQHVKAPCREGQSGQSRHLGRPTHLRPSHGA
jgi:hypothetical protein